MGQTVGRQSKVHRVGAGVLILLLFTYFGLIQVCGGHLAATAAEQHIYSHARFGDGNYGNKEDCDWIVEAPPGKNVHLSFRIFEMEDEQG